MGPPKAMSSSDTASSLFPDRPIRPLPKRRLRERLSPEVADSIEFPPAHATTSPLFCYPYSLKEEDQPAANASARAPAQLGNNQGSRAADSDEEESGAGAGHAGGATPGNPSKGDQARRPPGQLPPSTASSVDGYESFENTNNKKKRKIPSAGDGTMNAVHALADQNSNNGPASPNEAHGDVLAAGAAGLSGYYNSSLVSGSGGISGPGRGRFGRARHGRNPLSALSDMNGHWNGPGPARTVFNKTRSPQWPPPANENSGIISNAIANAIAEKRAASQGQENVSLLQTPVYNKSSPTSGQFTFTCDSQVPGHLAWPSTGTRGGPHPLSANQAPLPGTRPPVARSLRQDGAAVMGNAGGHHGSSAAQGRGTADPRSPGARKKKGRSKLSRELEDQARDRQREQELRNIENPPKDGEIYICPFCEFESINGYKPKSLIHAFEMKERKKRLEAERRQRLLEKAKARNRKGKKGKAAARTNAADPPAAAAGPEASAMAPNMSEELRSDEYDDEYAEDGAYEDEPDEPNYEYVQGDEADSPIAAASASGHRALSGGTAVAGG